MTNSVRKLKDAAVRFLLALAPLRRWIVWRLRRSYYDEFEISVPLSSRLVCPVVHPDAWTSFYETFIHREYEGAFDLIPSPARWIDLGCHAGFFSLYVLMRREAAKASSEFAALLVDGDSRSAAAVRAIASRNRLGARLRFCRALIAKNPSQQAFIERPFMSSSLATHNVQPGRRCLVPVLTAVELLRNFPPPYDLIKVDIEGAEDDFLSEYKPVWSAARHLLLEWHCWPINGKRAGDYVAQLEEHAFQLIAEISPAREVLLGGVHVITGVLLFANAEKWTASDATPYPSAS